MVLRILYINEAFRNFGPGPAVHGGALVGEMRARGATVDIYPAIPERGAAHGVPQGASTGPSPLRRLLRERLPQEGANFASGLLRTVHRSGQVRSGASRRRPDVILARHIAYDWTPWITARLLDLPLVLEVNAPLYLEKLLVGVDSPAVLRRMEEVQWRRATFIHAVSDEVADVVAKAGVRRDRIVVVPNGADPHDDVERDEDSAGPVRVLFVGGFYPWHGVEHLLRAAAALGPAARRLRLQLIGGGPQSDDVRRLAVELGIAELVEMPGRVAHAEVERYLRTADIAVAPYPRLNPFYFSPLKVFEYMAAGLPIVASDQGQMSAVLEHGRTAMLYPPDDIGRLAEMIRQLAEQPALRRRIGANAHAALKTRYTWGHTAEGILGVCRAAVKQHGASERLVSAS
jgi:glycosyltransferase involved in cell wall biosynthesis